MRSSLLLISVLGLLTQLAQAKDILIVRRNNEVTIQFTSQLQKNLQKNYSIAEFIYEQDSAKSDEEFKEAVQKEQPKLLVLLDNKAVAMAKRYYDANPAVMSKLPSVATLGLNLKNIVDSKKYPMAAIAYEIPGFALITQFRYMFDYTVENVLVLYRGKSSLKSLIEDAQKQLEREKIKLIPRDVDALRQGDQNIEEVLQRELTASHENQTIQAVWVFSDNALLQSDFLKNTWEKKAQKLSIPFLCTVEKLLHDFKFCSFAVFPSHNDLADQTAEMSRSILEDGMLPKDIGVEYVVSNQTALKKELVESLQLKPVPERTNLTTVSP